MWSATKVQSYATGNCFFHIIPWGKFYTCLKMLTQFSVVMVVTNMPQPNQTMFFALCLLKYVFKHKWDCLFTNEIVFNNGHTLSPPNKTLMCFKSPLLMIWKGFCPIFRTVLSWVMRHICLHSCWWVFLLPFKKNWAKLLCHLVNSPHLNFHRVELTDETLLPSQQLKRRIGCFYSLFATKSGREEVERGRRANLKG